MSARQVSSRSVDQSAMNSVMAARSDMAMRTLLKAVELRRLLQNLTVLSAFHEES